METSGGGCELPKGNAAGSEIRDLLKAARVIAIVGLSPRPERPSYQVAQYLQSRGYRIIPVRPAMAEILGEPCFPSLAEVSASVDIVDVFRASKYVPEIADQVIRMGAKALWLQEGIVHNEAAAKARAAGLVVVQSRCILKEHRSISPEEK